MTIDKIPRSAQATSLLQETDEMPEPFKCPIGLGPMRDPVFASDGHVYERENLQKWLDTGARTSPKTNEPLPDARLVTAWAIRQLMDAHPQARLFLRSPQPSRGASKRTYSFPVVPPLPDDVHRSEGRRHWRDAMQERVRREAGAASFESRHAERELERMRRATRQPPARTVHDLRVAEMYDRLEAFVNSP